MILFTSVENPMFKNLISPVSVISHHVLLNLRRQLVTHLPCLAHLHQSQTECEQLRASVHDEFCFSSSKA